MKFLRFFYPFSLVFFGLTLLAEEPRLPSSHRDANRAHVRIMCIGDSITEGGRTFQIYRPLLHGKLSDADFTFEFVGSKTSKTPRGSLLKHEGYGGKNIAFLAKTVPPHLKTHSADALLIHAGHNNFAKDKPVPGIIKETEKLITDCREVNPNVTIFLGQVITSKKLPKYSYVPDLNAELAALAKKLDTEKSHVILVDHATGFDADTMTIADKVHPNAAGAEHMAEKWAAALREFYTK